jgi:predicted amidohydrolase YtcJ
MQNADPDSSTGGAADSIVLGGKIYTVNPQQPWAQAVAVRQGKIVAVGSEADIHALRGPRTEVIEVDGHMVLPGFTDTHLHLRLEPSRSLYCEFVASTIAEAQQALRARVREKPNDPVVLGWALLAEHAAATGRADLDRAVPDRPVLIYDGHRSYANSKALQAAGITRDTPDPDGGVICRDPVTHEPTGVLEEAAGREALALLAPKPTHEMALEGYRRAFRTASEMGLVRLHSAGRDSDAIGVFDEMRRRGELPLRLLISTVIDPPSITPQDIDAIESTRERYNDEWIDANAVKFFQDGLVETHTAAMLEPYEDAANVTGETHWRTDAFRHAVVEMNRRGFHILAHATGDRSTREILDAYALARQANGKEHTVLRIEHAEHISDEDIARFARLGVIASMHPLFPVSVWGAQETCVGSHRMQLAFPWRSLARAGGRVAFGSDFPAYTLNPWEAIQALVAGHPRAEQRISIAEAISGYTIDAAYAGGREWTEGSLSIGKAADLMVVSQNLFDAPATSLAQTRVLLTMVGGRVVHRHPCL